MLNISRWSRCVAVNTLWRWHMFVQWSVTWVVLYWLQAPAGWVNDSLDVILITSWFHAIQLDIAPSVCTQALSVTVGGRLDGLNETMTNDKCPLTTSTICLV